MTVSNRKNGRIINDHNYSYYRFKICDFSTRYKHMRALQRQYMEEFPLNQKAISSTDIHTCYAMESSRLVLVTDWTIKFKTD